MKKICIAIALMTSLLSGCGSTSDNQQAPQLTQTSKVLMDWPNFVQGKPTKVVFAEDGCGESNFSSREDAFRCYVGDEIFDPCFVSDNGAICPESPWATTYSVVTVNGDAPVGMDIKMEGAPWGIELEGGIHCTQFSGATDSRGDHWASYGCDDDSVIWDNPNSSSKIWTVLHSTNFEGPLTSAQVVSVRY